MDSPELITSRLIIKPFSARHVTNRYASWLNDQQLMRFSEQRHVNHSLESCRDYFLSFSGTPHFFWAMEERSNNNHIGNINAYVDLENKLADIGIVIGEKEARGKGYGCEAWQAVMDFLFQHEKIRKISAGMMAENIPMRNLAHAAGMVEDGVRRRHFLLEGREVDIIYFAAFR